MVCPRGVDKCITTLNCLVPAYNQTFQHIFKFQRILANFSEASILQGGEWELHFKCPKFLIRNALLICFVTICQLIMADVYFWNHRAFLKNTEQLQKAISIHQRLHKILVYPDDGKMIWSNSMQMQIKLLFDNDFQYFFINYKTCLPTILHTRHDHGRTSLLHSFRKERIKKSFSVFLKFGKNTILRRNFVQDPS